MEGSLGDIMMKNVSYLVRVQPIYNMKCEKSSIL